MRKSERIISEKRRKMPESYKKADTSVNGDVETLVEMHKKVERNLYPLRIDKRTVIYVTKDKLTSEYAERYREKYMHIVDDPKARKGCMENGIVPLYTDEIKSMVDAGITTKDIARNLDISRTTVNRYKKIYNLRNEKK